jgi:Type II CAAX prenyl endopeptidase Rce1-like
MTGIFLYIRDYLRQNARPRLHLLLAVMLAAAFVFNYTTGFKKNVIDSFVGGVWELPVYLLYFTVPYVLTLLLTVAGTEDAQRLRNRRFWLVCAVMLIVLALNRYALHLPWLIVRTLELDRAQALYWHKCLVNFNRLLTMVLPVWIFKLLWDRKSDDLYGLRLRNFNWRPYLIMLAIMVPPIAWASFQDAFLHTYPIYRPGPLETRTGWSPLLTYGFHEACYALRFIGVELFFRGFMVLGMVRYLGRATLLPMVVLYAVWHFGKPFPEALGSIFGAYILGIIALYSRSINGGIMIHMGIALLMNLAAFLQIQFNN